MSHRTPSNAKRRKVKLYTVQGTETKVSLQNPSDPEIREQLLSGPGPDEEEGEIVWAVFLHHSQNTFIGVAGHSSCGFSIQHQEISIDGQWESPNEALTIDEVMPILSSYVDGTDDWLQLADWKRVPN